MSGDIFGLALKGTSGIRELVDALEALPRDELREIARSSHSLGELAWRVHDKKLLNEREAEAEDGDQ